MGIKEFEATNAIAEVLTERLESHGLKGMEARMLGHDLASSITAAENVEIEHTQDSTNPYARTAMRYRDELINKENRIAAITKLVNESKKNVSKTDLLRVLEDE